MKKYYVIDTNVLLHSPNALYAFNEHTVVIPEVVIEELDRFKKESTERGANSRHVSRIIDNMRTQGNLLEGVPLNDHGGTLILESNHTATTMPIAAACQGCHDDVETASHALINTSVLGESCKACHKAGEQFSVDRAHQRIF